jgi:ATP-dependent Lhr-like helicase
LEKWRGLSILYVCPLKALLNNIAPRVETYAGFVGARVGLWHGDIGEAARQRMLQEPPEILLTTPESIEAIFISARIDHTKLLRDVVVIDELHAFAGDDRGWHSAAAESDQPLRVDFALSAASSRNDRYLRAP